MLRKGIAVAGFVAFAVAGTANAKPIPQKLDVLESTSARAPSSLNQNLTLGQQTGFRTLGKLTVSNELLQRGDGVASLFSFQVGLNRAPSTNMGQKGNPALINMTMLLKMGGMHRSTGEGEGALSGTKKGNPALINTTMLIKMGGMSRSLDGANALSGNKGKADLSKLNVTMLLKMGGMSRQTEEGKGAFSRTMGKGNKAQLNMPMLIKMGGAKRLFDGAATPNPNDDRASRTEKASSRVNQQAQDRHAAPRTEPRTMNGLDHSKVNYRERVGNFRCSRGDCN
jgi:hypothetical protein